MRRWKYELFTGKSLREAIQNDSNMETLKALGNCYKEIHRAMPDWYTEADLEEDMAEIENQLDNCENYEEYDMTEDDVQDEINYMLRNFYDFCDCNGIWVGL